MTTTELNPVTSQGQGKGSQQRQSSTSSSTLVQPVKTISVEAQREAY